MKNCEFRGPTKMHPSGMSEYIGRVGLSFYLKQKAHGSQAHKNRRGNGSKSLEAEFQTELIQLELMESQYPDISLQQEAHPMMDNRRESSSVPGEFQTELPPIMNNGHKSSSVPPGLMGSQCPGISVQKEAHPMMNNT